MFFAKSTLAALRRIPNLLCLTSSMRQWLACRRRDRDAFWHAARRFKSVKEIKMLTEFLIICETPITEKCSLFLQSFVRF